MVLSMISRLQGVTFPLETVGGKESSLDRDSDNLSLIVVLGVMRIPLSAFMSLTQIVLTAGLCKNTPALNHDQDLENASDQKLMS